MTRGLAAAVALSFACACTADTGTLDLFPEAQGGSGGSGGSSCATEPCGTGGGGAGGVVPGTGGTVKARDAAMMGHQDVPDARPVPREAGSGDGCSVDRECGSDGTRFCVAGRCAECRGENDCTSDDRRHCLAGRCAECRSDGDCTLDKPGCVLSTGHCDDCSNDSQCESGEHCNVGEGKCR